MSCFLACLHLTLGMAYAEHTKAPPCADCWWWYDITRVENPYGIVELGWQKQYDQASIDIALRHESSMGTRKDKGFNSIEVRFNWFPFR